jgi:O-antigen/teichoic acid export membrane protein
MSFLRKLASDSALYGLNSILGRAVNFLLVPLHTRAFKQPADMAVLIQLFSIVTFLNVLFTYGMETAYFRYANSPTHDTRRVYNTAQSALLVSSLALAGLMIVFAPFIINWLGYPGQAHLVVWFAIIIALDAIVAIPFARLRHENRAKKYVTIRLASILINVGLNFLFFWYVPNHTSGFLQKIYNPNLGVGYVVLFNLIANLVYIPLLWSELVSKFHFKIDRQLFGKMWQYGYPLLILGLAGMVNQQIDRNMLASYLPQGFYPGLSNAAVLGIYGNCYKLSVIIMLATQSFRFAADPFFFSKATDKKAPKLFAQVTLWFTIVCCIIALLICLNMNLLGLVLGANYRMGLGIVPFLVFGHVFLGIYYNLAVWFKLTDRTYFGTIITVAGAILNVVLNYLLIPHLGFMGCAWAFAISCFAMMALCYVLGNKYYPIPYHLLKICGYMMAAILLILLNNQVVLANNYMAFGWHFVLLSIYILAIYFIEKPSSQVA